MLELLPIIALDLYKPFSIITVKITVMLLE